MSRLVRLSVLAAIFVLIVALQGIAAASHGPNGTQLWGYEAATNDARMLNYDIGTHSPGPDCVPPGSNNGRSIAYDPFDSALWYTFVFPDPTKGYEGDGLIHKASVPATCTAAVSIPFGDGPGGTVQDNVGALDTDPDDGHLWVAGYLPIYFNQSWLYKIDRITGSVLQSCTVPFAGGAAGNSTLAVAKIAGLSGSGKYLLTDAGKVVASPDGLLAVDAASCSGGGTADIVVSYPKIVGMTGIDFESGKLIVSRLDTIYDLGGPPFNSITSTMSAAPSSELMDITLRSSATLATTTPRPPAVGGIVGVLDTSETPIQPLSESSGSGFPIAALGALVGAAVTIVLSSCWILRRRRSS